MNRIKYTYKIGCMYIENGHSFVSAETLCKLCQFFNLPPKSFFDIDKISDRRNKKLNELIDKLKTSDKEKIEFYYNLINLVDEKIKYKENRYTPKETVLVTINPQKLLMQLKLILNDLKFDEF